MILLIDGNAFVNVAISVTKSVTSSDKRTGEKYWVEDLFNDGQYMLKEHVQASFKKFCLTYLNSIIAPVGHQLDGLHIVFDSKSWRKEYIADFFENRQHTSDSSAKKFEYKGSRLHEQQHHLFFDYFQKVIIPKLEHLGVTQYRVNGAEGDDIIAYLCEQFNDDLLIYSVDHDLKQLIADPNKNVLLMVPKQMSKTKKLFVPLELKINQETSPLDDFFSLSEADVLGSTTQKIIAALKGKDYKEFKIDPISELLYKIIGGDKSDEIVKISKMTPKKVEQVTQDLISAFGDALLPKLDDLSEDFINYSVSAICKVAKIPENEIEDIREHLIFNIKIIRLNKNFIPSDILKEIERTYSAKELRKFNLREFTNIKNNPNLI